MLNTPTRLLWILLMGTCLALVGCEDDGGGNDSNGTSESNVDVTGTWTGTIVDTTQNETGTGTMVLTQNGTSVAGTQTATWSQRASGTTRVTGSVNGSTVTLTFADEAVTQMSAQVSGNSMACTWTSQEGNSGTAALTRR